MFDELAERSLMSSLAGTKYTYVRLAIVIYCQILAVFFQYYLNHLNPELEILFQRPREASSKFQAQKDQVWFCISPIGESTLGNILKQCHSQPQLFPT